MRKPKTRDRPKKSWGSVILMLMALVALIALFVQLGSSPSRGKGSGKNPFVKSYTQGFTSDFSGATLYNQSDIELRMNVNGGRNVSRLLGDFDIVSYDTNNGMLNYYCQVEGSYDMSPYPKMKIKPLSGDKGYIPLNDFKVLTADFDIAYDIDTEGSSARFLRVFLNTWDIETNQTVISSSEKYHSITSTGPGHYTLVYYNTGDVSTMKVLIYKDGEHVGAVTDFINSSTLDTLVVSCLNIELPFSEGDTVSVDNVEFRIFDNYYDGSVMELIANPEAGLKSCKDAVLYEG